ncbi:MAG TPA: PD-(D/E)XK nuclease family protein [Nitrososphaera sp.]|nr:PD-(D/E)XK nuclease family protein [Nitrososphaera sp.]
MQFRKFEDLSELEKLSLIDISYSRLDTYETCPAKYFYTYIQKEDRLFGPAAALGNIVHRVLEMSVGEEDVELSDMLMLFDESRQIYDPDSLIDQELLDVGTGLLVEYVDRHGEEKIQVLGKEQAFSLIIGSARVNGYIDRVDLEPNDMIRVVDYKTGKMEIAAKDAAQNLQLGIYALATAERYPGHDIYAELYYLRTGRKKGHLFTYENLEAVYDRVLTQVNTIINDRSFRPTDQVRPCTYCDHQKSGACPAGRARIRRR